MNKHDENKRLYCEDWIETGSPWERWEYSYKGETWQPLKLHPAWRYDTEYRRKRQPLCQVEGRDVFVGDTLYLKDALTPKRAAVRGMSNEGFLQFDGWADAQGRYPQDVSWSPYKQNKTLYKWAWESPMNGIWHEYRAFAATEEEFRKISGLKKGEVRRLDHTKFEVEE